MAIRRKTQEVVELEHHMLDHCVDDQLRDELRGYFRRYPFSVVDEIVIEGEGFVGLADLGTGTIELSRSLRDVPCAQALHTYLHEVAHIIADDVHTLDFAALAAGLQQRFRCRDTARWRLAYDTHETTVDDWRTAEFAHLRRGGSVRAIADPHAWIERRRDSQEALTAERWREQNLWPSLVALAVAVVAVAGLAAWPWISELLANDFLMFGIGFAVAVGVFASALLSVNNT